MRLVPVTAVLTVFVLAGTAVPAGFAYTGTLTGKLSYDLPGKKYKAKKVALSRPGTLLSLITDPAHWSFRDASEIVGGTMTPGKNGKFSLSTPTDADLANLKDELSVICDEDLRFFLRMREVKVSGSHKMASDPSAARSRVTIKFTATAQADVNDTYPSGKGKFKLKFDGTPVAKR